jgi:hypothetical protein
MVVAVALFFTFDRTRRLLNTIWYVCTISAFLGLGYVQVLNWQDYSEKKANIVQQDKANWETAMLFNEKYVALEAMLAQIVETPDPNVLEGSGAYLDIFEPAQLRQCRIVTVEAHNFTKISGTTSGYVPHGGIFSSYGWVNLNQDATAAVDLREGQALVLSVEQGGAYRRLVFPSTMWLDQQRKDLEQKYKLRDSEHQTHIDEIFTQHTKVIDSLFVGANGLSTGSVSSLWALLQDRRNQSEDIIIDATALTGSFGQDAYYVDEITVQQASHCPEGMQKPIVSPGAFALQAYTDITERYMQQRPH